MSEESFRIIVAGSVLVAILAFVVQAALVIAFYGVARKMKRDTAEVFGRLGSAFGKVKPIVNHTDLAIEKTKLIVHSLSSTVEKLHSGMDRCRPLVDQTVVVGRQVEVLTRHIGRAAGTTHQIVQDLRPKVADGSTQIRAIVRSGRAQVEDVRGLVHDVGDLVRARLGQIDHAVNHTVKVFERASAAALRPVHAVNGLAAGVFAAVATFVRSSVPRKGPAPSQLEGPV